MVYLVVRDQRLLESTTTTPLHDYEGVVGSSDYSVPENPSAHHIADEGEAMTDVWSNVVGHIVRRIILNILIIAQNSYQKIISNFSEKKLE